MALGSLVQVFLSGFQIESIYARMSLSFYLILSTTCHCASITSPRLNAAFFR